MRKSLSPLVFLFIAALLTACGDGASGKEGKRSPEICTDCETEAGSNELSVAAPSDDLLEGGSPVTVVLKLKRQPEFDVTVIAVGLNPDLVTIEPAEFVFTTDTWSVSQLLTITPVDDKVEEDDEVAVIEFSLVSDDAGFGGREVNPLRISVIDDDEPGSFTIESETGFETTEAGGTIELAITLSAQPNGEVLAPVAVDDADEADIDVTQLQFDALNWNIAQFVTVTGKDDLEPDGDAVYNLVIGPTNSTDALFNNLPPYEFALQNIDGVCGNGVVDGPEGCEPDGTPVTTCEYGVRDCQTCTEACESVPGTSEGFCGDATIQSPHGEQCDGPTESCAYGEMSCQTCDGCALVAGAVVGWCGDGVVQAAQGEQCDPAAGACCSATCRLETTCAADCLIFSEYIEGTLENKALEIYNCEANKTIQLDGYTLCMVKNNDTDCSTYYEPTGTLAPGQVMTICNTQSTIPDAKCDVRDTYVTGFNGDDRIIMFVDLNDDHKPGAGEPVADAFGAKATPLDIATFESKVYSRCDFDPYLGAGAFSVSDYYELVHDCASFCDDDVIYDGLGVPPVETCP